MKKYIPFVIGLLSVLILGLSYYFSSFILFFVGILFVLIGVFSYIGIQVIDLYQKDKKIDYELVKKHGFTLINCPQCGKENIQEDIYCIHCGERLEKDEI